MAAQVPAGEQRAEPVRHGRHRLGRPLGKALGEAGQDGLRHAGALLHVDHLVAVGRVHLLRVHGRHGDLVVVLLEVLVELVEALLGANSTDFRNRPKKNSTKRILEKGYV